MKFYKFNKLSKWVVALAGLALILLSIYYSQRLANEVREFEAQRIQWFKLAVEDYTSRESNSFQLHDAIITADLDIPLILVNERGNIESARNYGPQRDTQSHYLEKRLAAVKANGYPPLVLEDGQSIYYEDSALVNRLRYLPILQILLITVVILLGYLGFQTSRRAEENRIWVGLAKETAHQLGTPLSAILAWIEYLRTHAADNPQAQYVADEITRDTEKLTLIADRFSKIGATPELQKVNVRQCLESSRHYMASRIPKRVSLLFPAADGPPLYAMLNSHLFEWVIENLLRNALDAMDGKGEIKTNIFADQRWIYIELSDTGRGISSRFHKEIFRPGYTTKSRGWGLGLSLAKRIVESYHKGRIYVKQSAPGQGTTFAIRLPRTQV